MPYTYDQNGNETAVETDITTDSIANDEVIHYKYDQVTNLLVETWTGGPSVTSDSNAITETKYGYTAQGQLQTVSVVRQNGSPVTGSPTTMYSYDADGNVTKISYPNGTETDYDYSQMWNSTGGIETVSNNRSGTVLSSFVYTFNAQREKIQSQEYMLNVGEASSTNTTITWQYDGDGRLTDETLNDGNADDGYHDRYFYDAAGNRIEEDITPTTSGASTTENYYQYNADGQLTTETDSNATSIVNHYDANGSLIETDSTDVASDTTTTTTYGYDERGRMTSMTKAGVTTRYAYNTNGDRVGEYNTSSSSTYVVDDNNPTGYSQVLESYSTGATSSTTTYVIGATIIGQTVVGASTGNGTQYIMPDGHGSTRQLTAYTTSSGSNGTVVAREDYDGFGNSITIVAVPANIASTVILYVGQMWDPGAQTYDDRAREYDPRIGRFNSFDGINIAPDDIVNANKYLYCNADPINMDDPSGHFGFAELSVSALISALAFSLILPNTANAPTIGGPTYGDTSGQLVWAIPADMGGVLLGKYVISPAAEYLVPKLKGAFTSAARALFGDASGDASVNIAARTSDLIANGTGVNITPSSVISDPAYSVIGKSGRTFITDLKAVRDIIGPLDGDTITITTAQAQRLQQAIGLTKPLESENVITLVTDVANRSPAAPIDPSIGNELFQGAGKGLPGGGPELTVDGIPTRGSGAGITRITLKVGN